MATDQSPLIYTRQTWLHYIGGYYTETDKFINEAIKSRISRRAPAQQVRGMQFGDRLILLRYLRKGMITAFGEAQIIGITFDHEIAKIIGDQMIAEGKAEFHEPSGGATVIQRECGSYILLGSWIVTCSLSDVMELAIKASNERGEQLFVMINAELTKIYDNPIFLSPAPKFFRGFQRADDYSEYIFSEPEMVTKKNVFAIQNYSKKLDRIKKPPSTN